MNNTNYQQCEEYSVPPDEASVGITAQALTSVFIDNFRSQYDEIDDRMWANFDQDKTLREAYGRARKFGSFYKEEHGGAFWRFSDGVFIIHGVVIGPVTIVPGKAHWDQLKEKIFAASRSTSRLSFDIPVHAQVKKPIFKYCIKLDKSPDFLDDETAQNGEAGNEDELMS